MCSTKNPAPAGLTIPSLTIRSDGRTGITTTDPELMECENGSGVVRSLKVEMGPYGEVTKVTAELLPTEVLLMLESPKLLFALDGQEVTSMTLKDGSVIQFC